MRRALLVLQLSLLAWNATSVAQPAEPDAGELFRRAVNDAREGAGLPAVATSVALEAVADEQAADLAARPRSERLGRTPSVDRLLEERGVTAFRRTWQRVDLTRGPGIEPAEDALERWRASPTAWRAALDPSLTRIGVGRAASRDGWTVLVIVLAEPLERAPEILARWERWILDEVNGIRAQHDLPELDWREDLAAVARAHSEVMAQEKTMSHLDPRGRRVGDRLRQAGIGYRRAGENIANNRGLEDPARIAVKSWLKSAGHRRQILDPGFSATGVGIALAEDGAYYFTQVFVE
jgi:uncharacterized protein YkwD